MSDTPSKPLPPPRRPKSAWTTIALFVGLVLLIGVFDFLSKRAPPRPAASKEATNAQSKSAAANSQSKDPASESKDSSLVVRNVRVLDEDKHIIYSGDVDLRPTLDRIQRGERLRFANDGSVFENRERRLPRQSRGYYHEYVHPTPGQGGPGAQRVVIGDEGETYYTPDHYRTFRRVR